MNVHERLKTRVAPGGWRTFAARRWPLLAGAAGILLVAAWALARGRRDPEPAPSVAERPAAAADSVVALDSTAQRLAGIELVSVVPTAGGALVANGTIAFDENRVSIVAPRAEGRILAVRADLGQPVEAGTPLATLSSVDVGQARGDLDRASAAVQVARRNYEREKRLFEQSISPEKEMLDAEVVYRTAEADLRSAGARLQSLGATSGRCATHTLASPIAGTVVTRNAMPGQLAGPETDLFTVADLRHVWITVDVYEADLSRVRKDAVATVTSSALPSERFTGRVTYAGGIVDPNSRTLKVRVEVENPELRLRPGMYAQVRIDAPPLSGGAGTLRIPEVAVQELNGKSVVFVAAGAPGRYVVREVETAPADEPGTVVIRRGLAAGERVVVRGAFQLKAELTKASFGKEE